MTIPGVRAARYDTTVECGGAWSRVIRRANLDGPVQMTEPTRMDVYQVAENTAEHGDVLFSLAGVLASDGTSVTFTMPSSQTAALAPGRYEHRMLVGDPVLNDVVIILRGYLSAMDGVRS